MKKSYEEFRRNLMVNYTGKELLRNEGYDMKVSRAKSSTECYLVSIKSCRGRFQEAIGKLEYYRLPYIVFDRCL